jgi:GMP synthase PP-ATPase subunit
VTLSALWTILSGFGAITLIVGAVFIAYRSVKVQTEERATATTIAAQQVRITNLMSEKAEAIAKADLYEAENRTLRTLTDNTELLHRIAESLERVEGVLRANP